MKGDCGQGEDVNYLLYAGFAPISLCFWVLIGVLYLNGPRLSPAPGSLIAVLSFSYAFNLVSSIAMWPGLEK